MTRKLLVGVLAAGALIVTAGTAFAFSPGETPAVRPTSTSEPTSSSPSGDLSADDASRLVRERVGGTVREVEREEEHGRAEWKVEITARDGKTYEVRVDASSGAVIRTDQDDDEHGGDDD